MDFIKDATPDDCSRISLPQIKMGEWRSAYSLSMPYVCLNYGAIIRLNHQYENWIDSP